MEISILLLIVLVSCSLGILSAMFIPILLLQELVNYVLRSDYEFASKFHPDNVLNNINEVPTAISLLCSLVMAVVTVVMIIAIISGEPGVSFSGFYGGLGYINVGWLLLLLVPTTLRTVVDFARSIKLNVKTGKADKIEDLEARLAELKK